MKLCSWCLVLVLFVITSCTSAQEGPIKIGFIGPLTGAGSSYGVPGLNAAQLAVEDINAQGGINGRPIELIIEDGKCDGAAATTAANKLIDIDQVTYLLAGHCSTETMSILPIINEKQVFMIASTTGTDQFSGAGKYAFRTFPSAKLLFYPLAEKAYEQGARSVVTFSEQLAWPQSVVTNFVERFEQLGGKVLAREVYSSGTADFRTQIIKIKNLKPDAVMVSVQGPDSAAQIIKQSKEIDLNVLLYGDSIVVSPPTYEKSGGQLPETAWGSLPHVDPEKNQKTKEFLSRYNEKYGEIATNPYYATENYDAVVIAAELIKKCNQDLDCARNHMITQSFEGVTGVFTFDEKGDPSPFVGLARVVKGKLVFE